MIYLPKLLRCSVLSAAFLALAVCHAEGVVELKHGDRICLIGNTLAERFQHFGYFETLLQKQNSGLDLSVRNLGYSADEVRFRPRSLDFGTPDSHLTLHKADVVLAFFGFNESFAGPAGINTFRDELRSFITNTRAQKYNGTSAPRLVLYSPIAHEDIGDTGMPDGKANNQNLQLYTDAIREVAGEMKVPFVDLLAVSTQLYAAESDLLTFNGIHLSESGYRRLAPTMVQSLTGKPVTWSDSLNTLRKEVLEKNFNHYNDFRAVNGYYIYGGRSRRDHSNPPFTDAYVIENERAKLREMAAISDQRIWAVAAGKSVSAKPDYSTTRKLYDVPTNFKQEIVIKTPDEAMEDFVIADGYKINLFASEIDWPELKNPVNFSWDAQGRLWVATMPSYPQFVPPNKPNDKLLIFEDQDGDGRADKMTVFADELHVPTGFELGDGGVYVAQEPNLVFLKDTDGDGKADVRRTLLHGFDSGDSHHAIGAFIWGPGGGLYMHEGTFHHTQVETPWGPQRNAHGGIYRFDPTRQKLETFVSYNFANPWGHCFDRWGQNFVADASGGANYWGTAFSTRHHPFTGQADYGPFKFGYQEKLDQFFPKRVRPTSGCEIVSSRHFPDEAQGRYLLNNVIGVQGILWHEINDKGSGFVGKEVDPMLLYSKDRNFRPTDLQFGPDGALYLVDWFNPLIGHMQHSLRDPNRDKSHGRIWRITYPERPLVERPKIVGRSLDEIFEELDAYEDRTRQQVRTHLREYPTNEVLDAGKRWLGKVADDKGIAHHELEVLWVCQHHNAVNEWTTELLKRVLGSSDFRARAAGVRVLSHWRDMLPADLGIELLTAAANDDHPRVRAEAVRAASWFDDARAAEAALAVLQQPTDYYVEYLLRHTIRRLEGYWMPAVGSGRPFASNNPKAMEYLVSRIPTSDLINADRSQPVYLELLKRPGVVPAYRKEALEGLAKANGTTPSQELVAALTRLDETRGAEADRVLSDMGYLVTHSSADDLRPVRDAMAKLAAKANRPLTQRMATLAVITAAGSADAAWNRAVKSPDGLRTLLETIPLIKENSVRAPLYDRVASVAVALPASLSTTAVGVKGRYVRIELPGKGRTLTLAEVEVLSGGENVALKMPCRQKSVDHGGVARNAVDGDSNPVYGKGSQTHTKNQNNPWWQVDLRSERNIESVAVYNRMDGSLFKRLDGFTLKILDDDRKVAFEQKGIPAPRPVVNIEISKNATTAIRRSAIKSLSYIPGNDIRTFKRLLPFFDDPALRHATVQSLSRLDRSQMSGEMVSPLVNRLIEQVRKVPAKQRTQQIALDMIQLCKDLSSKLPEGKARDTLKELSELAVDVFVVRPIPHRMQFDRPHIYVQSGKSFEVVFENTDIMPHNLLVTTPGAREEVGILAERLGSAAPNKAARDQFRPDSEKVLIATHMLQPGERERLQITAPTKLGDYPYVCTFPGHWRTMYGTIHVVADISQVSLEDLNVQPTSTEVASRSFVREWSTEDLMASIDELNSGAESS